MEFLLFLLLGTGVGIFGSLVGIGGGLICVPVFIFFMSEGGIYPYFSTAAQITGTSLFIVLANAMSGAWAYIRQKRVFFHAAIPFAIATLPGAFLGSWIVDKFTVGMLNLYYGIFIGCMAMLMYWNATRAKHENMLAVPEGFQYNRSIGIVASMGVGFLSSIFGVGGGIIHVPMMVYVLDFPVHIATATSCFILAVSALGGTVTHVLLDHVVWLPAVCISIGAAAGAQIGARISRRTRSKTILVLLALAMLCVSVRLIISGSCLSGK